MVRIPGMFKNFDDLEESLNLNELETLLDKARDVEHDRMRFAASLKGIDLDKGQAKSEEERFNEVKRKAEAQLRGMSEEELEFEQIGITFTVEE